MAKSNKSEDEKKQNQLPQDPKPGGDPGNEFVAGGENPIGEPEGQEKKDIPPADQGEKPKTIVVGPEGEPIKGPEYQPEQPAAPEPELPQVPQAPGISKEEFIKRMTEGQGATAPEQPEAPKTFKHKSGMDIPYSDFEDETVVWAEKYDPATRVWDTKRFTRTSWDNMTRGKARNFRHQSHSGWTRLVPSLPEWDAMDFGDDDPEGGEGRVGPRPGDRNNP